MKNVFLEYTVPILSIRITTKNGSLRECPCIMVLLVSVGTSRESCLLVMYRRCQKEALQRVANELSSCTSSTG